MRADYSAQHGAPAIEFTHDYLGGVNLNHQKDVRAGSLHRAYGTRSLRRTKASIIYKATGNLRAVQLLLGHSKIENSVCYLGVDIEDALALAEGTEI